MRRDKQPTPGSRLSLQTLPAVSVSGSIERAQSTLPPSLDHVCVNHRSRNTPMPRQLLDGTEICSRFEEVIGKRMPKRMTTGKFVYLGPTDRLPDCPL